MKQWKNILERGDYIGSFKGLDKLALKPEVISAQKPIFRFGYEGGLVCRRELRSEEEYLKSFTPFVNKKTAEYLDMMRKAWFEPNGLDESVYDMFFGAVKTEAEAIEEQREVEEEPESPIALPALRWRWGNRSLPPAPVSVAPPSTASLPGWARGSLDTRPTSNPQPPSVGGGGSAAAAAALPSRVYEDLEATRVDLEGVQDTLEKIHDLQEMVVELRQSNSPAQAIAEAEAEIESLYRRMGLTPGEVKQMIRETAAEMREVPRDVKNSIEFHSLKAWFEHLGMETKKEYIEYARVYGISSQFVASSRKSNLDSIIYGFLKAGHRAPPSLHRAMENAFNRPKETRR